LSSCRRRGGLGSRHPLHENARRSRDRKPLNSADDATYDLGLSAAGGGGGGVGGGMYARNVAFEPAAASSRGRRRAPAAHDDDDDSLGGGATQLDLGGPAPPSAAAADSNEYEYVWDAAALAARASHARADPPGSSTELSGPARASHRPHRRGAGETGSGGGGSASTSFGGAGGRPAGDHQCRCMARQVSAGDAVGSRYKPAAAAPAGRKAATLGRFGHLESRSAARAAAAAAAEAATGKGRAGRVADLPRRVCPHCGHLSSSAATGDGAACGAGTPPSRLDHPSLTLPRRHHAPASTQRRA